MVETWSISAGSGCDCMQSRKVEIIVTTLQLGGQPWPAVESHNFDINKLETLETWLGQNVLPKAIWKQWCISQQVFQFQKVTTCFFFFKHCCKDYLSVCESWRVENCWSSFPKVSMSKLLNSSHQTEHASIFLSSQAIKHCWTHLQIISLIFSARCAGSKSLH